MLWLKAFHVIFVVTWFAGLGLLIRTSGSCPSPASLGAGKARAGSRSLRSRAGVPARENSPAD